MDKEKLLEQLKALADNFVPGISEDVIAKALSFSRFKSFAKGELIARTGEKADSAGLVICGVVRSFYVDDNGNDITQHFASEGNWCMDSGMLGFSELQSDWEAILDSTVMIFDVRAMRELIYSDEKLKDIWIGLLESAIRYKIYREHGFLIESAKERYISFTRNFPTLAERIQQRYVATFLGIKPESLSRIRSALKEKTIN